MSPKVTENSTSGSTLLSKSHEQIFAFPLPAFPVTMQSWYIQLERNPIESAQYMNSDQSCILSNDDNFFSYFLKKKGKYFRGSEHTTPEELENGGFTRKTHLGPVSMEVGDPW